MFKRATFLFFMWACFALSAFGQSTTVSGLVTDSGGQSWNNGTYRFQFVPNPQYPNSAYTWTGGAFNSNADISGSLSSSGSYSVSIPSNANISPVNSQWKVVFCPQASSGCYTTAAVTIFGGTQTLNATPPPVVVNAQGSVLAIAYADSEVGGANVGSTYFNSTLGASRVCTALPCSSNWATSGSAANPDPPISNGYVLTTTGAQTAINLTAAPIDTHDISWRPSGTVSTCSIQLDTSPDSVTWTSGGAIPAQTCTSSGSFTVPNAIANYVRVNLVTLTGGGTLTVVYSGRLSNNGPHSVSGNELYVNAGEAIFGNTSGSNLSSYPFDLTIRFHPINGPIQTLTTGNINVTSVGQVMAQATPTLYIAFPTNGFLEFAELSAQAGSLSTGQAYAQIMLGCSNLALTGTGSISSTTFNTCSPAAIVLAGHNTNGFGNTTWPAPSAIPALQGPGNLTTVTVSNPAAGSPAQSTLSNVMRHNIIAVTFSLTTSATVINRFAQLTLSCNGNNVVVVQSNVAQGPSTTVLYSFLPGIAPLQGSGTVQTLPMPAGGITTSYENGTACILNMTAGSLQAADTITSVNYRDLTWEENN